MLEEHRETLEQKISYEVIIVDDASKDGTKNSFIPRSTEFSTIRKLGF